MPDRCMSVSPDGLRCGLDEGHAGPHHALTPTGELWTRGDGKNACPNCGRRVRLRRDGCYPKHNLPGTRRPMPCPVGGMGHIWVGRRFLPDRYGQPCRLLVARRGKFLVEFADGWQVATTRGTFRRLGN